MGKVKVVGYAKRVFYDDGIEYRNFSPDLVGNQSTNEIGSSVFTSGNFSITTNLDSKVDKIFVTNDYGDFISLDDINDGTSINSIFLNKTKINLNLDNSDVLNYAFFGSLREYVRVSLENIIINWPASLYVRPYSEINPTISGSTALNYNYDPLIDVSTFEVHTDRVINNFDINYFQDGSIIDTFNETNDLRNLTINYASYVISNNDGDFTVIGFTGTSTSNSTMRFEVMGNPFPLTTDDFYHIKPNLLKREEFFISLNNFESNLLNRNSTPIYTAEFKVFSESDNGTVIESIENITWPVSDSYNIDFLTSSYTLYVNKLISISDSTDNTKSNLISRFLVSQSISEFDTIPNIDGTYDVGSAQKMTSALKIYGREFDEIKRYIDGISFANTVTYSKNDNAPDLVLKNLSRILGWDLTSSIEGTDLVTNYLKPNSSEYDGIEVGLTNVEADIELWRRVILNTPWIWKSKGTRKAIEFLFKFIGTPDGLVTFNEYIYVANDSLDVNNIENIMEHFNDTRDISTLNVDSDGFPKVLPDNPDMYFQKAGLWYRTTGGPNPDVDILYGNNPHIGPYDGGQAYIDQFSNCLVPNFVGVSGDEETIKGGTDNLFTNFNNGDFGNCCDGEIIAETSTDIDFSGMLETNLNTYYAGHPTETGCTPTNTWKIKTFLAGEIILFETFFTGTTVPDITDYVTGLNNLSGTTELSGTTTEYDSINNTYTFNEDFSDCITKLKDVYIRIDVTLASHFECPSASGYTSTSQYQVNQFIKSGSTFSNTDNVSITDENGVNVSNCLGLSVDIVEFTDVTCDNALEIIITEGVNEELICDYTGTTLQSGGASDGLVLLTYSDGSTSLNVHPDCCVTINPNYVPEIGTDGYYVCRWRELFDPEDCANYTLTNTFDIDDYAIYNISTGGTTTIVPSAECCYNNGLVDELTNSGVKCKEAVTPVCADYVILSSPSVGDTEFTIVSTGASTFIVPTIECCTVNGLSGRVVNGGYTCYNALNPPTVQITLNSGCCEEISSGGIIPDPTPTPTTREYYMYPIGYSIWQDACDVLFDNTDIFYHNGTTSTPREGNTVYINNSGSIFNGHSDWYSVPDDGTSIRIDSTGKVIDLRHC